MATRKKTSTEKSESAFSVIVSLAKMGDDSIRENYELLKDYRRRLSSKRNLSRDELVTLRRMIRLMRMKSLVRGDEDLFKKLGELDKSYKKLEDKIFK